MQIKKVGMIFNLTVFSVKRYSNVSMNKEEIIKKIESIRKSVDQDQFEIITDKILERKFHIHHSNRNIITKKIIESIRRRMVNEVSLILESVLERQREINLRFLKELKRIKEQLESKNISLPDEEKKVK